MQMYNYNAIEFVRECGEVWKANEKDEAKYGSVRTGHGNDILTDANDS